MLDGIWSDFAYAWRRHRRHPALALAIAGTMALAIGLNASVFTDLRGGGTAAMARAWRRPPRQRLHLAARSAARVGRGWCVACTGSGAGRQRDAARRRRRHARTVAALHGRRLGAGDRHPGRHRQLLPRAEGGHGPWPRLPGQRGRALVAPGDGRHQSPPVAAQVRGRRTDHRHARAARRCAVHDCRHRAAWVRRHQRQGVRGMGAVCLPAAAASARPIGATLARGARLLLLLRVRPAPCWRHGRPGGRATRSAVGNVRTTARHGCPGGRGDRHRVVVASRLLGQGVDRLRPAAGGHGNRAAPGLRQRRQPAARPRRRAPARDRHTPVARRHTGPAGSPAAHRERGASNGRWGPRSGNLVRRPGMVVQTDDGHAAEPPVVAGRGQRRLRHGDDRRIGVRVRPGSSPARHANRPDAGVAQSRAGAPGCGSAECCSRCRSRAVS